MLIVIHKLGGDCKLGDIHKSSGIDRSTISHAMPGLAKLGYVEREARRIRLTEVGLIAVALIRESRGEPA